MQRISFHGVTIEYDFATLVPRGWLFAPNPGTMAVQNRGISRCAQIEPNGDIQLIAWGHVDAADQAPALTLGFVQSILSSTHRVEYADGAVYSEVLPAFPVKDGSGEPWYKDRESGGGLRNSADLLGDPFDPFGEGKQADSLGLDNIHTFDCSSPARQDFHIGVDDAPYLRYPDRKPEHPETEIRFQDVYCACLVARIGDWLYPLQSVVWEMNIHRKWKIVAGRRVPVATLDGDGIRQLNSIIFDGGRRASILNGLMQLPAGIVLETEGEPANRRKDCRLVD